MTKSDKKKVKPYKTKSTSEDATETSNDADCIRNKQCTTNCHESFYVDVRILPEVTCKQIDKNSRATFEIELDIDSSPKCRVIQKEVYDPNTCKTIIRHILLVESDVKLDCIPKIKQIGKKCKPSATYEMDIIVDTDTKLRNP